MGVGRVHEPRACRIRRGYWKGQARGNPGQLLFSHDPVQVVVVQGQGVASLPSRLSGAYEALTGRCRERVGMSTGPIEATSSETWWTAERAQLYQWFERNAPGLAPVYRGAAQMALDQAFPGRVHFVAHAIRDIRNRLPDALAGEVANSRTQYGKLATAVHTRWVEDGLSPDGVMSVDAVAEPSAADLGRREVSAEFLRAVGALVAGHLAAGDNNESRARRLYQAVGGAPPPAHVIQEWKVETRWAQEHAHARNKPLPKEAEESLADKFRALERALHVIANRSYENMDELDEILDAANR